MAEETAQEVAETNPGAAEEPAETNPGAAEEPAAAADMELEAPSGGETNGATNGKRSREEGGGEGEEEEEEEEGGESKKLKAEKSVEEERLEKEPGPVKLGAKEFGSSVEMYDYFFKFLHFWPPHISVNQYEHMMILELIKKGHAEPEKKIGPGIKAFQVRYHPVYKSRCFFIVREDDSTDDFSFRKCVDQVSPLPEDMQVKHGPNRVLGGGGRGRGGGGGHGRGRGRGGRGRH